MKARTPITAVAAETRPPERRGAAPMNMVPAPWELEGEAAADEEAAFFSASTPVGMFKPWVPEGVAMEAPEEAGVAMGTWTGIME